MRTPLFILCILCTLIAFSSCSSDRTYFHNKNGHIRSARAGHSAPWHTPLGSHYNKPARRVLKRWQKSY